MSTNPFSQKILKSLEKVTPKNLAPYLTELSQQLELQEFIWNSIQEGILITNKDGGILLINEPFLRMFQISQSDFLGQSIQTFLEKFEFQSEDFIQNLFEHHQILSQDLFLPKPLATWCRMVAVPYLVKGQLNGTCISFKDITDLKQEDQKRIHHEKWNTLIPLAAGLAHEIGNPLNSLNIHMQLAERQTRDLPTEKKEKISRFLSTAQEEIKRLDKIVAHFLGAIRPLKAQFQPNDINSLLDSTLDFMRPEISLAKITVERRFQTNLPTLLIDSDQLKQAFYNLLKNAIQAMPKGGDLKVQTELKDKRVSILFSDSGIGIKPQQLPHIFEPYYSTKEKGSGLGLVVVNRIINEHGGTIEFKSKQGKGSQFELLLPLSTMEKPLLPKGKSPTNINKRKKS